MKKFKSYKFFNSLVAGLLLFSAATQADNITHKIHGKTIGNWGHAWWVWALQFPAETFPIIAEGNVDCSAGQNGKVWFLAGTFGTKVERTCTIKKGKALFFPIINSFPWTPEDCDDLADCRETAAAFLDPLTTWTCTVDGVRCVFKSEVVRAQSDSLPIDLKPGTWVTELLDNEGNVFYEPGIRQISISDGNWVMLEPLPPGDHVIHFTADKPSEDFALDVTYHLTVSNID